jgi:glutamate-1-semialdehyde 2,1-aminomutase
LTNHLRAEDFEQMIPLAAAWTAGVQQAYERAGFEWHVQQLGARAEYWFCPPPRDGAAAAAAVDAQLDAFMHLFAINRGILLTPFHNMALFSPHHTVADVDHHTAVFAEAVAALAEC